MGLFKDDPQPSSAAGNTVTVAVDESVARVAHRLGLLSLAGGEYRLTLKGEIAIKEYSAALGQR